MARRKRSKTSAQEKDAVYFLKILLFFIVGAIWVRFTTFQPAPGVRGLPIGLIIGVIFAAHEHFQIDRKVEYAVLLAAAILSFVAPVGIVIEV